jgi:CubicO group peptidase (beta-lactamase class C family)
MQNQLSIDGSPMAMLSGGLRLQLRDFAKLGVLVQDFGLFKGRRIVSEDYIRLATSRFSKEGQWPMMIGQGEQVCGIYRERGLVIAWMSSTWVNNFGYRVAMRTIDEEWFLKEEAIREAIANQDTQST